MDTNTSNKRKRVFTEAQRERNNAYLREYRAKNRERVAQWRRNYILRAADRLRAEAEAEGEKGGAVNGGN